MCFTFSHLIFNPKPLFVNRQDKEIQRKEHEKTLLKYLHKINPHFDKGVDDLSVQVVVCFFLTSLTHLSLCITDVYH